MKSAFFHSIALKISLVLASLSGLAGVVIFISNAFFSQTILNIEQLQKERLPALVQSSNLLVAANSLGSSVTGLLSATNAEVLSQRSEILNTSIDDLGKTVAEIGSADLQQAIANIKTDIGLLTQMRNTAFESDDLRESQIRALGALVDEITKSLERRADEAQEAMARAGQTTIDAVENELVSLIDNDVRALRLAYQSKAASNLASGVSLTLTQTTDQSLIDPLRELNTEAIADLKELVTSLAEIQGITFDPEAMLTAITAFDAVSESNPFIASQLRSDILDARARVADMSQTLILTLIDKLEASTSKASSENKAAINELIEKQVQELRYINALEIHATRYVNLALRTASAATARDVNRSQKLLAEQFQNFGDLVKRNDKASQKFVSDLEPFSKKGTGLYVTRTAGLNAEMQALYALKAVNKGLARLGELSAVFGQGAMNEIEADSRALLENANTASNNMHLIGLGGAAIFLAALLLTFIWLVKPLTKLTRTTERLANGDLSEIRGFAKNKGEIGRMVGALSIFRKNQISSQEMQKQVEAERETKAREQQQVVSQLAGGLKALADGNLTTQINGPFPLEYEMLREDFNRTLTTLRDVIEQIVESGTIVKESSEEISGASQDLAQRTERSAAALETSASSLQHLSMSITQSSDNAGAALSLVQSARTSAKDSHTIVESTVNAMEQIANSAKEVKKINGLIDDIAFQTNLLALNAGVEAARAGEAGLGFAVVASEVRALAQRATDAAKEIGSLLNASEARISEGVSFVSQTETALTQIGDLVGQVNEKVSEIASSVKTQAHSVSEINESVGAVDQDTQKNAAMFEETTAASISLNNEAKSLSTVVQGFQLDMGKNSGVEPAIDTPSVVQKPAA